MQPVKWRSMETPTPVDQMPLVGGTLVFDFLNTGGGALEPPADSRASATTRDLLSWGRHAGAVTEPEAARLAVRATEHDQEARSVVARAREQRRYLYELFSALHEGRRPPESAMTRLRDDEAAAISHAALIEGAAGFDWSWAHDDGLDRPLWPSHPFRDHPAHERPDVAGQAVRRPARGGSSTRPRIGAVAGAGWRTAVPLRRCAAMSPGALPDARTVAPSAATQVGLASREPQATEPSLCASAPLPSFGRHPATRTEHRPMSDPKITRVEVHQYASTLPDLGRDYNGFNVVYEPGATATMSGLRAPGPDRRGGRGRVRAAPRRWISPRCPMFVQYLFGKNALERERIYTDVNRALRQMARIGYAPVDIALWDLAGKFYDTPVHRLLGGYKERLPCLREHLPRRPPARRPVQPGGVRGLRRAVPRARLPGVQDPRLGSARRSRQEIANVHAVGKRVGGRMDLMLDPACEYMTFGDALKVGWACDEERFFWYEDPYRDGGTSQFAPPQAAPAHPDAAAPDRAHPLARAADRLRRRTRRPTSCAATSATTASPAR